MALGSRGPHDTQIQIKQNRFCRSATCRLNSSISRMRRLSIYSMAPVPVPPASSCIRPCHDVTTMDDTKNDDTKNEPMRISRRDCLTSGVCMMATMIPAGRPARAEEVDLLRQSSQDGTPFVLPALAPQQYLDRIGQARPQAWAELRRLIDDGFYKRAAESLILFPFDDVAQSAFYLPWAILRVDEDKAVKVAMAWGSRVSACLWHPQFSCHLQLVRLCHCTTLRILLPVCHSFNYSHCAGQDCLQGLPRPSGGFRAGLSGSREQPGGGGRGPDGSGGAVLCTGRPLGCC